MEHSRIYRRECHHNRAGCIVKAVGSVGKYVEIYGILRSIHTELIPDVWMLPDMADDSNLEMPSRGESRVANLVFYGVAIVLESLTRASHATIKDAPSQSEQTCQCPTSCRCCRRAKYTSMMSVCSTCNEDDEYNSSSIIAGHDRCRVM